MKRQEDTHRQEKRRAKLDQTQQIFNSGKIGEAMKLFRQALSISHSDTVEAMKRCRAMGVECMVAPFESDSQLTYLQKIGLVDYILSEDSDLLVFGEKAFTKIINKINFERNTGQLINLANVLREAQYNHKFLGFNERINLFNPVSWSCNCSYSLVMKFVMVCSLVSSVLQSSYC